MKCLKIYEQNGQIICIERGKVYVGLVCGEDTWSIFPSTFNFVDSYLGKVINKAYIVSVANRYAPKIIKTYYVEI